MENKRTIFKQPIREGTTAAFFPDKMSLDCFVKMIKENIEGFEKNMKQYPQAETLHSEKFIEEWTEMFLAWSEIEEE